MSFEDLRGSLASLRSIRPVGRIVGLSSGVVAVSGLAGTVKIGDRARLISSGHLGRSGEFIQQREDGTSILLPDGNLEGLSNGCRVVLEAPASVAPHDSWIGRVIDADGKPMDGKPLLQGAERRPLQAYAPPPAQRQGLGARLDTGFSVFDTILPIVEGQRMGIFAGSGVGKSSLLADFARQMSADVIVLALVGERGRELRHFVETTLGPEGMARSVVVAATSDQSPLLRRRCAWTAMSTAEYFRDRGYSVLFMIDSITRFAEAHREIATAAGEAPVLRGYPPSTAPLITKLCERAGPGAEGSGSITGIFSVLVAGSDMEEPIADILRGVLDGHTVLDRSIAESGRFPAVDVLRSVSRSLPAAAKPDENEKIGTLRRVMSTYAANEMMLKAGLYNFGSDPEIDQAHRMSSEIEHFLSRKHAEGVEYSFAQLDLLLRRMTQNTAKAR